MTTDALGLPYSGASKFIELKDDSTQTYVRPISTTPILGNKGSRIFAYIENHCLPVLLDTGADITVMSKSQLQALVRPSMSNDRKTVNLLMEEKSLSKVLVTYSCISYYWIRRARCSTHHYRSISETCVFALQLHWSLS